MQRTREHQDTYRHNLEIYYEQIDRLEEGDHSWSYIKTLNKTIIEQLIKNGRHLSKDNNFNKYVNKMLESIAMYSSLYSIFYPDKKPLYMYNLDHYSDTLNGTFISNFEGNFIGNNILNYPNKPLENIGLYAKILQHYDMFDRFNPALMDSYIQYANSNSAENIYESINWFYLTDDTTPEIDKIIINNILKSNKAMEIINNISIVDNWVDDLNSPLHVISICEIIAGKFNHTFSVRDRFFRNLPEEYQLGYFI